MSISNQTVYLKVFGLLFLYGNQTWNPTALFSPLSVKRFIRKGIPAEFRSQIWMEVSGASLLMSSSPGFYQDLLSQSIDPKAQSQIEAGKNLLFYKMNCLKCFSGSFMLIEFATWFHDEKEVQVKLWLKARDNICDYVANLHLFVYI